MEIVGAINIFWNQKKPIQYAKWKRITTDIYIYILIQYLHTVDALNTVPILNTNTNNIRKKKRKKFKSFIELKEEIWTKQNEMKHWTVNWNNSYYHNKDMVAKSNLNQVTDEKLTQKNTAEAAYICSKMNISITF